MIKLTDLLSEASKPKKIHSSYIERTGKLYSTKVDGKKVYGDGIKKEFGIDIPTRYNERDLDKITKEFKKQKIAFTYDDIMDVS